MFISLEQSINQYSESISWNNPSSSAMTITSASVTITFNGTTADDTAYDPTSQSGSLLYAGQTITLGIASAITATSKRESITVLSIGY